jgi:hypothetical protein
VYHSGFNQTECEEAVKIRKSSTYVLFCFVTIFSSLFVINPVFANYQGVNVLVAYDEEFDYTAQHVYWYSPEYLAEILITEVSWRFEEQFNIKYIIIHYVCWDSDDNINNIVDLRDECIAETGFYSGIAYNTIPMDIMIAFSDQETGGAYGISNKTLGVVLAFETYLWLSLLQCTDNVLQHELSHLYNCTHHIGQPTLDCTMNTHPVFLNYIEGYVPYTLTTENWCNDCINLTNSNRETWGREVIVGGGPGGPGGPYPLPESEPWEGPL